MTRKNIEMYFPLWDVPYSELMKRFKESGAKTSVSAVAEKSLDGIIKVGDEFNEDSIKITRGN